MTLYEFIGLLVEVEASGYGNSEILFQYQDGNMIHSVKFEKGFLYFMGESIVINLGDITSAKLLNEKPLDKDTRTHRLTTLAIAGIGDESFLDVKAIKALNDYEDEYRKQTIAHLLMKKVGGLTTRIESDKERKLRKTWEEHVKSFYKPFEE